MNESQKVRIIVAFGDLSGFTAFCENVTNDEVEYHPFMAKYDKLIERVEIETGYNFDDTGDGFMCTVDIASENCSEKACEVLINLWGLLQKIGRLVKRKKKNPPAPSEFRIVGAAGYGDRTMRWVKKMVDGKEIDVPKTIVRGRHLNRAHNWLDRARGHGFVCDETLKQLVIPRHAKKYGITFAHLEGSLWILKITH